MKKTLMVLVVATMMVVGTLVFADPPDNRPPDNRPPNGGSPQIQQQKQKQQQSQEQTVDVDVQTGDVEVTTGDVDVDTDVDVDVSQETGDIDIEQKIISESKRPLITAPLPGLPTILSPENLPTDFKIYIPKYQKVWTIKQIKRARRRLDKQYICRWLRLYKNDEPIKVLSKWPAYKPLYLMGVITVRGGGKHPVESTIAEALYWAKRKTRTKKVVILMRTQYFTRGGGIGLGGSGATSMATPKSNDNVMVAGTAGPSLGWSSARVDSVIWVVAYCFSE